ncbi:hypothetical protein [Clostridium perfringens]|uniref:Uncharacterized protein n=1 Tax=Clostridium perfringens TaxID=1502 RepID=A0AAP4EGG5_CLOPF|nr:hypothetical protein [Clostridium perfringens]MDH2337309.1 hypothetical protein [Clostridium perfringens]
MVNYEKVIENILERQYEACKGIKCVHCCVLDECCHVFGDITPCDTLTKERFVKGIKEHMSLMCE